MTNHGDQRGARAAVLADLLAGRISLDDADRQLRVLGQELLSAEELGLEAPTAQLDPSEYDPMGEIFWTLAMVMAWIPWRRTGPVREAMPRWRANYRAWRRAPHARYQGEQRHHIHSQFVWERVYQGTTPFQTVGLVDAEGLPTKEIERLTCDLWRWLEEKVPRAHTVLHGAPTIIAAAEWPFLRCAVRDFDHRDVLCLADDVLYTNDVLIEREAVLTKWPGAASTVGDERRAEVALRELCTAARAGAPWPKGVEWRPDAVETFGVTGRGADRVWARVAKDFPELSSPKGKPKAKRGAN